jgi:hypothetical protein
LAQVLRHPSQVALDDVDAAAASQSTVRSRAMALIRRAPVMRLWNSQQVTVGLVHRLLATWAASATAGRGWRQ